MATNTQIPHESLNLRTPIQALVQSSGSCQRSWTDSHPGVRPLWPAGGGLGALGARGAVVTTTYAYDVGGRLR
ncbi:MAG: hypothetical protein ACP5NF_03905, partial [Thermoanaerobaculum sp.]